MFLNVFKEEIARTIFLLYVDSTNYLRTRFIGRQIILNWPIEGSVLFAVPFRNHHLFSVRTVPWLSRTYKSISSFNACE